MIVAGVSAQSLTLVDGNMSVTTAQPPATSQTPPSFDLLSDALAINQGYEHWWYYRVNGDASESALRSVTSGGVSTAGDHADRDFDDLDGRGVLKASVDFDTYSSGSASGVVISRLTVMNISAAPIVVDLFAYTDLDVAGTFGNDVCTGNGNSHFITDPSGIQIEVRGVGADRSDVGAFPSVRNLLTNGTVNDLGNNLPPFLGDYTGAFQWTATTLQPFEERTFQVVIAVDTAALAVPEIANYGAGNGSNFQIHCTDLPLQDNAQARLFSVRLKGALPNALYRLVTGLDPYNAAPFIPDIDLWVSPPSIIAVWGGFTTATGEVTQSFVIPPSPYLAGFDIYHQGFYVDAAAPNGFAYQTTGMRNIIGKL